MNSLIRSILSVVAGSVVWTTLWLIYNAVLKKVGILSLDDSSSVEDWRPLSLLIAGSVFFSIGAGYITTLISRSNGLTHAWILACAQLALGVFVEVQYWRVLPFWYHALFLLLLVPATLFGGYLKLK